MTFRRFFQAVCVSLIFSMVAIAGAKDWPRFMGPDMTGVSDEKGLADSWPASGPRQLWTYNIGEGFAAVSVANGRAITMGQKDGGQYVVALDAEKGTELWKVVTNRAYNGNGYPGPRSTPAIDGDRVYAFDGVGRLLCLNAADGKIIWDVKTLELYGAENMNWGVSSSPLIDDNRLYIHLGSSRGSSVLCLNKMTGAKIWASQSASGGYSSPMIREINGKRQLISYLANGPMGLDLMTGATLWSAPWKTAHDVHAATPIVLENYVFIASGYNVGCGVVLVEPTGASVVRKNRTMRSQMSSPRLYNNFVYGFDENAFAALDPGTLQQTWSERYGKGAFTIADDKAYILHERGGLTLARLAPEKITVLSHVAETPLKARRNWTMPVIANGKMYCRNESILVCYDVAAK